MLDFPFRTHYPGFNQNNLVDVSLLYLLNNQMYTNRYQLQTFLIRDTFRSTYVPGHRLQENEYHLRSFRGKIQEQIQKKIITNASFKPVCHFFTQRKPEYRLTWSWESPPFKPERGLPGMTVADTLKEDFSFCYFLNVTNSQF